MENINGVDTLKLRIMTTGSTTVNCFTTENNVVWMKLTASQSISWMAISEKWNTTIKSTINDTIIIYDTVVKFLDTSSYNNSIKDVEKNNINVTHDNVVLMVGTNYDVTKIDLFNISGLRVGTITNNNYIYTDNLSSGIYIAIITIDSKQYFYKFNKI
jgi:hypothetical protein